MSEPRPVAIRDHMIRLGQLLQLAGIAEGGADAKALLASLPVLVNGELEDRRGRQLVPGDVVEVAYERVVVVGPEPGPEVPGS